MALPAQSGGRGGRLTRSGDPLREAAEVMRAVHERCVWSQGMSHRALAPYLIEESAELVDAIERGSPAEIREELGDVLWQVLFHAQIAARAGAEHDGSGDPVGDSAAFDIDDVARDLTAKMVHRHPHVFGDAIARTPDEVLVLWNAAKAEEKRERRSALEGIAPGMPSLALAQKMLGRGAAVGASPPPLNPPVVERAEPSVVERAERDETTPPPLTSEAQLGDELLRLVAVARERGWDAERALRERLRTLETDIRAAESR
ncbi:MazG family protein [Microbacterium sp. LRZ72]|uniref:MazG family protein n=1 Tax=Microbacterium sp. LRZ72 TaxID=2942481 RepID=UPI0029ACC012|nr:MazG family protein [Microbacterium sp. LRZ72]MDX2375826.1 MazG family protein [Microbacterium sp. LRZ72]